MFKALLINPPQTFHKNSQIHVEQLPLGLLSIAAALEEQGIDVEVLDSLREGDNLSHAGEEMRYGLSWEEISKKIKTYKPNMVGISNPYSAQVLNAIKIAQIVKSIDATMITVIGGNHPTVAPFELMRKESNIDICVLGEGERVMVELCKGHFLKTEKKIEDIPGLVYRDQKRVLSTSKPLLIKDIDRLPLPAYEKIDIERYLSKDCQLKPSFPDTSRVIEMITSRGCPFNCIFCSVQCVMGNKFRAHSPDYVLKHIEHVINRYKVEHIRFNDDNISLDKKRFNAILSGIIERKLQFSWNCPNGVRADTLDETLLKKMKRAGCKHIYVAAESGSQEVINRVIGKKMDLAYLEHILMLCDKVGIKTGVYFVLGLPGEKLSDINQTKKVGLKFLSKYNASPLFFMATPLPGTRLLDICKKNDYLIKKIDEDDLSVITQGRCVIRTESFTPHDVENIYKSANRDAIIIRRIRLLIKDPAGFFKKMLIKLFTKLKK